MRAGRDTQGGSTQAPQPGRAAAGQLTSNEHQDDREDLLVVSVRGYVAKADGYEPGETKVEGGTVPALKSRGRYSTGSEK